tara:strand:+ start:163 stop:948 length:786 start_codon:yes stop_codon:yes gene_type:complete
MSKKILVDTVSSLTGNTDLTLEGAGSGVPNLEAGFKVGGAAGVPQASIQDQAINEAKLQVSNAPVNGYNLTAQSSNTGGLTWAEASGGGAWNLIGSVVASGSSTLTITGLNNTYNTYAVAISEIRNTADSGTLTFRIGDSSGIDSGGSDYATFVEHLGGDAGTGYSASRTVTNGLKISERAIGNATGESYGAMIYLHKAVGNGTFVMMHGAYASTQPDATISGGSVYGFRNAVITMTQVQLSINTNTIATGRMTVWGIAHA